MPENNIQVSPSFRKKAKQAIFSIIFFAVVYLVLVAAAICLTVLAFYGGMAIISNAPSTLPIIAGIGMMAGGVMLLVFLVKFIFTKNVTDRSHLVEITEAEQPRLFAFVRSIVNDTQSKFPKKIYLSADVNAAVFYDSSFWSMFFPVKKNLQIGMGLVNTVSENEFRAILAHEFGHFSQRSMKVGSYVYNVNKVIYNMLFENTSYRNALQEWANISGIFYIFSWVLVNIIKAIQWILRQVYRLVNISHMQLSREMEFHADEVAAFAGGSAPLVSSLRRLNFAALAFNNVLNYYNEQVSKNITTANIYPQQLFVMKLLAVESSLPVENGLPQVTDDHLNRYNKSKLVIIDQWASHPSTEDRVNALRLLNREIPAPNNRLAITLFDGAEALQELLTRNIFGSVQYNGSVSLLREDEFETAYHQRYKNDTFPAMFNSYYNNRNMPPVLYDDAEPAPENAPAEAKELFSNAATDLVFEMVVLENDINILKQLQEGKSGIKTFEYNGQRHQATHCAPLVAGLENELLGIKQTIEANDRRIDYYFSSLAKEQGKENEMRLLQQAYINADEEFDQLIKSYARVIESAGFFQQQLRPEAIQQHLPALNLAEKNLKADIRRMLEQPLYQPEITDEAKEDFRIYLSDDWAYFEEGQYNHYGISVLSKAAGHFQQILSKTFLRVKRDLLHFMAQLETQKQAA